MADEATLLIKIKTILDKSTVMRDIKMIGDKVQNAVGLGGGSGGSSSSSKSSGSNILSSLGSGMMKGLKFAGKFLSIGTKIFAGVSIVTSLLEVFSPALKMVNVLFKQVAEFIRPISDIFVMLLSPLLTMTKPIVQMFRTLMAPFKQIAVKGLAAANMLISGGMKEMLKGDKEKGKTMLGAGIQGALSSASLLMSGFMDILLSPLKNIKALRIGDAITSAMDSWESSALAGIMKVSEKADLIRDLGDNLSNTTGEQLKTFFTIIDDEVNYLKESVGGFTVDNFKEKLQVVQNDLSNVFNSFIATFEGDASPDVLAENFVNAMKDLGQTIPSATEGLLSFTNILKDLNDEAMKSAINTMMPEVNEQINEIANKTEPSKWKAIGDAFRGLGDSIMSGNIIDVINDFSTNYENSLMLQKAAQEDAMQKIVDTTKTKLGIMGTENEQYFNQQLGLTNKYFSKDGLVISTVSTGMKSLEDSGKSFVNTMDNMYKSMTALEKMSYRLNKLIAKASRRKIIHTRKSGA